MIRKVFKTGNSLVVSLSRESIELLQLHEGSEINFEVDADESRIILSPARLVKTDIDPVFARQLDEFIEQYRPALESLAE